MLRRFEAHQFRCFDKVVLDLEGRSVGLVGPNASGKTSLLEGLYFLSYGRSFRVNDRRQLIKSGASGFRLLADVDDALGATRVSVRYDSASLSAAINDIPCNSIVAVAARVRAHLIDPSVHRLIEGLPQERRRLLDTGVFHVEHAYLANWRRFRRALKQRNAALRGPNPGRDAQVWNAEFCAAADAVHQSRLSYVAAWSSAFRSVAASLGLMDARLEYRGGWPTNDDLESALRGASERDAAMGSTSYGPQRGDVRVLIGERTARQVISRGQQKLLASAMVLGQLKLVEARGHRPLLLIDDAGAELDVDNLGKFLSVVAGLPAQLIVTATFPGALESLRELAMFHVKQDGLTRML
jgi:DNA replication and repair protein RecF